MKFRIALAQIDPVLGNLPANIEKHLLFARRAAEGGAQLVIFPELSLTGYSVKDMNWTLAINPRRDARALAGLVEAGKKISILAGGIEEGESYGLYNAAFYFEAGEVGSVHRKTYPPTYGMFEEMRYFSRGTSVRAFDSKHGRFGALICEDLWHIPLPYLLAADGASVILTLVASPTRLSGSDERPPMATVNTEHHKAYARLLSLYIVFCNRVGFDDGVNFWGGSEVVDPSGNIIVSAGLFKEDLVFADIDEDEIRRARRFSRHFLDDDPGLLGRELARIQGS